MWNKHLGLFVNIMSVSNKPWQKNLNGISNEKKKKDFPQINEILLYYEESLFKLPKKILT